MWRAVSLECRTPRRPAGLATVAALITAGIASSRAEAMRWAIGRIRENPACTQIQERAREINELKAQF